MFNLLKLSLIVIWLVSLSSCINEEVYNEWSCLNNYKCVNDLKDNLLDNLRNNKTVKVGAITVEPVPGRTSKSMKLSTLLPAQKFKLKLGKYTLAIKKSDDGKFAKVQLDVKTSGNANEGREEKMMEGMVPMLVLVKGGGLLVMAIAAIGLLSFKALVIGKIALVMASILTLKKLIDGKHNHPVMMVYDHHDHDSMYPDMEVGAHSMPSSQYAAADLYSYGAMAQDAAAAGLAAGMVEGAMGQDGDGNGAVRYTDTATLMEMMNQQLQQQAAFNETLSLSNKRKDVRRRRPVRRRPVSHYHRVH